MTLLRHGTHCIAGVVNRAKHMQWVEYQLTQNRVHYHLIMFFARTVRWLRKSRLNCITSYKEGIDVSQTRRSWHTLQERTQEADDAQIRACAPSIGKPVVFVKSNKFKMCSNCLMIVNLWLSVLNELIHC